MGAKYVKTRSQWEYDCPCGRFYVEAPTEALANAEIELHVRTSRRHVDERSSVGR